jgi:hypothetical protein
MKPTKTINLKNDNRTKKFHQINKKEKRMKTKNKKIKQNYIYVATQEKLNQ